MTLTIELDHEHDGRWIAEARELPGVMCYGNTRDEAISNAERLAIDVIADRIAHHELSSTALSFVVLDAQLAPSNPLLLFDPPYRIAHRMLVNLKR